MTHSFSSSVRYRRRPPYCIPSESLVSGFGKLAGEMIQQMRCLKRSTLQLTQALDILLPRLMSGEVTV